MSKPYVFVSRMIPQSGLDMLEEHCEFEVWEDELPPPRDVLLKKVANADGLLCLLTDKVNAELLDRAPKLKVVSNMAVGFDNIDVPEITKRKIPGGNTPGVLTDTTADLAWALLMAAARRVTEGERYVHEGKWKTWGPLLFLGVDVHHSTLGIVGMGRIGKAMARRGKGFDMDVVYYDSVRQPDIEEEIGARFVSFDELLRVSDFVSVHTTLKRFNARPVLDGAVFENEGDGYPHKQRARAYRQPEGPVHGAQRRRYPFRRAGCDRPRTDSDGRSAADAGELYYYTAYRQWKPGDAEQNVHNGCRKPAGGAEGRTAAQLH